MNQTKSISLVSPRAGRWLAVAAVVTSMAVLGGCANRSASSGVYSYDQAQREQIVRTGTVTGVRPIVIQNDKSSGAGMLAGGALGGVAGNAVGGGTGRTIATVGGAILGALAGNAIENSVGKSSGYEITVRLDNGETRVVAQEADVPISVGQRVQVISGQAPRASPRCKSSSEKSPRKRVFHWRGPRRKAAGTPRRRAPLARGSSRSRRSAATRRTVITLEMPYFLCFPRFRPEVSWRFNG